MKNRKKIVLYGVCICGMMLLVLTAVFLPQEILRLQDYYRTNRTETEMRESPDISNVTSLYETNIHDRLKNFASMDKASATVAYIGYDMDAEGEMQTLVQNIFSQGWCLWIPQTVAYEFYGVDIINAPKKLNSCQKYIVYGNDYQNSIALIMWYLDLYIEDGNVRVQLVVDAETSSIYYMKITNRYQYADIYGNVAMYDSASDKVVEKYDTEGMLQKQLEVLAEIMTYFGDGYVSYYNAQWKGDVRMDGQNNSIQLSLDYEELNLDFAVQLTYSDVYEASVCVGIPAIGDLVFEMIQD